MPWVTPAFAAELWNIPVEEVMNQAHRGFLPTLRQHDWTFVDFSVGSEPMPPKQTWSALSAEEMQALNEPIMPIEEPMPAQLEPVAPIPADHSHESHDEFEGWSHARKRTQQLRRPPVKGN